MTGITAQVLVGNRDWMESGIWPTHAAWLEENGRAAWVLRSTSLAPVAGGGDGDGPENQHSPTASQIVWLPASPERIVEDVLLLTATHVLGDPAVLRLADEFFPGIATESRLELSDIPVALLAKFDERCREIDADCNLVMTVLPDSSLDEPQLRHLERYRMHIQVCTPRAAIGVTGGAADGRARAGTAATTPAAGVRELLVRSREILADLHGRDVVRSWNAPAGDYDEWLVQRATEGRLAQSEQSSGVAVDHPASPGGEEHLQVEARVLSAPATVGLQRLMCTSKLTWL